MKTRLILIVMTALLGFGGQLRGQGIAFIGKDFNEALARAKAEKKILFVDFYADWCGPCKQMDSDVFPNAELGSYFAEKMVAVKVDTDNTDEALLDKYDITSLPTMAFIDGNGKLLLSIVGTRSVEELLKAAKRVAGDAPDFQKMYDDARKAKNNAELTREVLKEAPAFVSTLNQGMEQDRWIVRIERMFKDYYTKANMGPQIITADDYRIINTFNPQPAEGDEIAEFMIANIGAYIANMGKGPAYYVVEYNDRSLSEKARAGKDYKKYLARITGDMKEAYDAVAVAPLTPEQRYNYIYEGEYLIYSKKDAAAYVKLMDEYFAAIGEHATATDYGQAAQNIYYATGGKVSDDIHQKAKDWLVKALQFENIDLMNKINLLVMLGDSNRTTGNIEEARKSYNQAFMETLQLSDKMSQGVMQMQINNKLGTLEVLK